MVCLPGRVEIFSKDSAAQREEGIGAAETLLVARECREGLCSQKFFFFRSKRKKESVDSQAGPVRAAREAGKRPQPQG